MSFTEGKFYTREMARALRQTKKPFTFTMDVSENDFGLMLLVYESEIRPMNDQERLMVMQYLWEVAELLESFGPTVSIEGVPGEPRRI